MAISSLLVSACFYFTYRLTFTEPRHSGGVFAIQKKLSTLQGKELFVSYIA